MILERKQCVSIEFHSFISVHKGRFTSLSILGLLDSLNVLDDSILLRGGDRRLLRREAGARGCRVLLVGLQRGFGRLFVAPLGRVR